MGMFYTHKLGDKCDSHILQYHLECIALKQAPTKWICKACETSGPWAKCLWKWCHYYHFRKCAWICPYQKNWPCVFFFLFFFFLFFIFFFFFFFPVHEYPCQNHVLLSLNISKHICGMHIGTHPDVDTLGELLHRSQGGSKNLMEHPGSNFLFC